MRVTRDELIVAAHSTRGVGQAAVRHLLTGMAVRGLEPHAIVGFTEQRLQSMFELNASQARCLREAVVGARSTAGPILDRLRRVGASVVTLQDASYPLALNRWMPDPPPVLYLRGDHTLLRKPLICLANSRDCPPHAAHAGETALAEALSLGFVVVTGHNRREYQSAALTARRRAAPVCYVLDRGLLPVVEKEADAPPFSAARIWPNAPEASDLVLSALPPTAPGLPGANKLRDRLIVALATCCVSSHVRPGGHMEEVLRDAAAAGKRVGWLGPAEDVPIHLQLAAAITVSGDDGTMLRAWLSAEAAAYSTQ